MKISCQTCGQILPKTAVMCPNCGGRTFLPFNENGHQQGQHSSYQTHQNTVQPTSFAQPQFQNQSQSQHQPQFQQPQTPPLYVPPVAPPIQTYQQPVQPIQQAPVYQATSEPNYESSYPPQANLPPTYYADRHVASNMRYAGFFRRGFAFVFDLVLVGLLLGLGYQMALPKLADAMGIRGFNEQSLIVAGVCIYLFYMAFLTCVGRQATIGKIIMGLWVFGMQGQRIGFFQALFREMLKVVLLPFFFVLWFTARKQTLADLMARTVVLYDPS